MPVHPRLRCEVNEMSAVVWSNWLVSGLLVVTFVCAVALRYPGHGGGAGQ